MPTEIKAVVKLVQGMHFHGENARGLGVEMDSMPAEVMPSGMTPMELVLQAAGGCSLMDVAFILRKRRIPLEMLTAEVVGVKRDTNPKIYEKIEVVYRAKGEGVTVDELNRAVQLSISTYCSVFGMLQKSAEVTWRSEVIE
jgi:putative redox protein